jgi:hypothetical protein
MSASLPGDPNITDVTRILSRLKTRRWAFGFELKGERCAQGSHLEDGFSNQVPYCQA